MNPSKNTAFTLVELMIVVAIIGLLAALAMPVFSKVRQAARHSRLANDMRQFSDAINQFALETGDFPADTSVGQISDGLAKYIKVDSWHSRPIIGGSWDVARDGGSYICAVGVVDYEVTEAELAAFDKRFDDGDFSTGLYQKQDSGYFRIVQRR
ncbi:type II secretion system protein [Coraliomargarita akajimensis]|uniref:Uncharacterized protein n=1 Tax=Coraliomargarita akajimensis (strain DSM 45221 / IAM 15411 / JCM 23193 / KCTC 12865 / 04OKA010-24) TaxID=583355 RepID=D5EI05_CORAD|nr:type II secretion system protein [Coraliomargarita akajimensis]ADE56045.1 conserved hypothetical protein [Coraliomargarita akajimensis DSM 45221]